MPQEPIAIVGSACRFPGHSTSPSKLWELLRNPRDVQSRFPADRLNLDSFTHPDGEHHGSTNVDNKSYILEDDIRNFDASFFNINPREAEGMSPQQRLLLEVVYECFEDAGHSLEKIRGSQTSCFVGVMNEDMYDIQLRDPETMPQYSVSGNARSFISNRVSWFFDIHGESMTIDTACSSSLVCLHEAVQSLRAGHSDAAIVAGANLLLDPPMYINEGSLHMLSSDARSRMWDAGASGYARGEGIAALYVKTLSKAIADGDHIDAIVRETGVNFDGRTKGITMPSAQAQAQLIRDVYRRAGLDIVSERCQYFECHGTGTKAGDPIEAEAVHTAFFPSVKHCESQTSGDERAIATRMEPASKLLCGGIKSVIGHTEGCAGVAGVMKVMLMMKHEVLAPNMLFKDLNPALESFMDALELVTEARPWPQTVEGPMRASVNSFGVGGVNAHAIIESHHPEAGSSRTPETNEPFVGPLMFSAKTESSLNATIRRYHDYMQENASVDMRNLARVLSACRSSLPVKTFFSGSTKELILDYMSRYLDLAESGAAVNAVTSRTFKKHEPPGILGVFTGQGAQYAGMGRELLEHSELFRETIEACEQALSSLQEKPDWSLASEIKKDPGCSRIGQAAFSQPLCTAVQLGMVAILRSAKVPLSAVVGHSSGEIAATHAAGIISLEDAIRIAYLRGYYAKVAQSANGKKGSMLAAAMSYDAALEFCDRPEFQGRLNVAASNSPAMVTLSGDIDAIEDAKEIFDQDKTFARQLVVDTAYHSAHMQPCATPYLESLKRCNIQVRAPHPDTTWVSSVRGDIDLLEDGVESLRSLSGQYWVDNMVKPVLFSQAVEHSLWNGGPFDVAIEIGPHPALKGPTTQTVKSLTGHNIDYASLMRRGDPQVEALAGGLGYIWQHIGTGVDFDGFRLAFESKKPDSLKMMKDLPSYAWDYPKPYWRESRISRNYRLRPQKPHELLGRRVPDDSEHLLRWRNMLVLNELPYLRGHEFQGQTLFPATGYVAMALQAAQILADARPVRLYEIKNLRISRSTLLEENHPGVETELAAKILSRGAGDMDAQSLTFEFTCSTCTDETAALQEKSSGQVTVHFGEPSADFLPTVVTKSTGLVSVEVERFVDQLRRVGLNYTGPFEGITSGQRTIGFASAVGGWTAEELNDDYVAHPAVVDVAMHVLFMALCSPASDKLSTAYLPIQVDSLLVNPVVSLVDVTNGNTNAVMSSMVNEATSAMLNGDCYIADTNGNTAIQIGGLGLKAISPPTASNDRLLYAKTLWGDDVLEGVTAELEAASTDEIALVEVIERTLLHYLQDTFSSIMPSEVRKMKAHHQLFFEATIKRLDMVQRDQHPAVKKKYLGATRDWVEQQRTKYLKLFPGQVDLELTHRLGRNLKAILEQTVDPLNLMLEDGLLDRFYEDGVGLARLNRFAADAIKQITYKHPQVRICEIGSGTGGTASFVLSAIQGQFVDYTYTDVSAGFFTRAEQKFKPFAEKMIFKVLDIEKDTAQQGFETGAYDVVLACNVLHATRSLQETMEHTRSLLKPGGYLILMEVTGELMRHQFMFSSLPGWWRGADEGRRMGPNITPDQWDEMLLATGFSGIDQVVYDTEDAQAHSCSVIISCAVDDKLQLLRQPLDHVAELQVPDKELVIVGGSGSFALRRTTQELKRLLTPMYSRISMLQSIDNISSTRGLNPGSSVIVLQELDKPIFSAGLSDSRLKSLQTIFANSQDLLWLTAGWRSANPECAMTVALGRMALNEFPHVNLQWLDIVPGTGVDARSIAQEFLRLCAVGRPEFRDHEMLWNTEREVVIDHGRRLIPRIIDDRERNDRFNASRREIFNQVDLSHGTVVELTANAGHLELENKLDPTRLNSTLVDVVYSMTLCPSAVLVAGQDTSSDRRWVLALAASHASTALVESGNVVEIPSGRTNLAAALRTAGAYVLAKALKDLTPSHGTVLLGFMDSTIVTAIESSEFWNNAKFASIDATSTARGVAGLLSIHPHATLRSLRDAIPKDTSAFLDLTGCARNVRIHAALPKGCVIIGAPTNIDKSCLAAAVAAFSTADDLAPVDTININESIGRECALASFPTVFEWPAIGQVARHVKVRKQPLCTTNMFSNSKTYFLVGMAGELGRSLCKFMIDNGARYFALASRSAKADAVWLDEVKALGAVVHVYRMDVTDVTSVRRVREQVGAALPPIGGVCNGAMVLRDAMFADMTADTFNETLAGKVDGSKVLDAVFSEDELDFFVFFSSLASIFGNGGQANYHAANLFMASLAEQRRERGAAASVIHIGMIVDVGIVARLGRHIEDHLRSLFFLPLTEEDFHNLFAEAVLASPANSGRDADIIFGAEPFQNSSDVADKPQWLENPRFSHFMRLESSSAAADSQLGSSSPTAPLHQRLALCSSEEEAAGLILVDLAKRLEQMLQMSPGAANVDVPLLDLGVDSLLAVEIRTWFLKEMYTDIPVLKVLSGDTIRELCMVAATKWAAGREVPVGSDIPNKTDSLSKPKTLPSTTLESESTGSKTSSVYDGKTSSRATTPPTTAAPTPRPSSPGFKPSDQSSSNPPGVSLSSFQRIETMSHAQSRLWVLRSLLEDHTTYNFTMAFGVHGEGDIAKLNAAARRVFDKHEILRTCFFERPLTGELLQGVLPKKEIAIKHVPVLGSDRYDVVDLQVREIANHKYELEKGDTVRMTVVTHSNNHHTLILGYHHIVLDGVSHQLFLADLDRAYCDRPLKPFVQQYIDFTADQRDALAGGKFDVHIDYWMGQHTPLPQPMPVLPIAKTRTRKSLNHYHSRTTSRPLSQDLTARIKHACQKLRVTPAHFHLTVLQLVLTHSAGVTDMCIGIVDANRSNDRFKDTLGFLMNLLPVRLSNDPKDTFAKTARNVSKQVYEAMAHSALPFDLLLDRLHMSRATGHSPLFQVAYNFRMGDIVQTALGKSTLEFIQVIDAENPYDLSLAVTTAGDGTTLVQLTGQAYLYEDDSLNLLMDFYEGLIEEAVQDNNCLLSSLHSVEKSLGMRDVSLGQATPDDFRAQFPGTFTDHFDQLSSKFPDDIAVKDAARTYTWHQLRQRVDTIAHAISQTVEEGSRVVVLTGPCGEFVAAMLGIIKAGCIYTPLDLSLPPARHAAIVKTCKPALILYTTETALRALDLHVEPAMNIGTIQPASRSNFVSRAKTHDPAFLLYTSGSTGVPKGVALHQAGFMNFLAAKAKALDLGRETFLQQSSLGFDMSISQTLNALFGGGRVFIVPQEARGDPMAVSRFICDEAVTVTIATPTEYRMMLEHGKENLCHATKWKHACSGGEAMSVVLKREFASLGLVNFVLSNWYGPTEISAAATFDIVSLDASAWTDMQDFSSIGRPLTNTSIYILDQSGWPMPVGMPGEICIGGPGVALGYVDLPDTTAEKFIQGAWFAKHSGTLYRTGDKGRLTCDGQVMFMGRLDGDSTIKLRGLRIDTEDVASTLVKLANGSLSEAVVTVRGEASEEFLVAHVVLLDGPQSHTQDEVDALVGNLPFPQYMIPSFTIILDRLPMTSNGKVDRKLLETAPLPARGTEPGNPMRPRMSLAEGELQLLWRRVLPRSGGPDIGPGSDFFLLGGSSLLLAKLQGMIRQAMGVSIPLAELYRASTLAEMAHRVSSGRKEQPHPTINWESERRLPLDLLGSFGSSQSGPCLPMTPTAPGEVLVTGATSFLGRSLVTRLLASPCVRTVHCIGVPADAAPITLTPNPSLHVLHGSLLDPSLGLSPFETSALRERISMIVHAGSMGHCLNQYSSLCQANYYSTRHITQAFALPRKVPMHFVSSNRVALFSGDMRPRPCSVAHITPDNDGSEGYTATKWVSEAFLEDVSRQCNGWDVTIHRPCAVTGSEAPPEDALNALLKYSRSTQMVPRFENFTGYFDFEDVETIAERMLERMLGGQGVGTLAFQHYSSGKATMIEQLEQRLAELDGSDYETVSIGKWVEKAREAGIEELIVGYLEAVAAKGESIKFPFMGEK